MHNLLGVSCVNAGLALTSTSTTTQASRPTTLEAIRDTVNRELTLTNPADVVDVLHRLLANARDLLRRQRLLNEALEETLLWLPQVDGAPILNGRTVAENIGDRVIEEAGYGDFTSLSNRSHVVDAPAVLLQPDLPSSVAETSRALPHLGASTVAGLRRRSWRTHVANLHAQEGISMPSSSSEEGVTLVTETFTDLFLVQSEPGTPVTTPVGCAPFPTLPRRGRPQHRRRLHAPRPCPVLCERSTNLVPASPSWVQWEASSPTVTGTPTTRRRRSGPRNRRGQPDRSRSRDLS